MTPKLKYGPKHYKLCNDGSTVEKPRIFTEIVLVKLCKKGVKISIIVKLLIIIVEDHGQ